MKFVYGAILCFFGGTFPVLFAAIEAADHGGRKTMVEAISDLSEEAMIIIEESKKDSSEDKDGDGVKDVHQISSTEYMTRKTKVSHTQYTRCRSNQVPIVFIKTRSLTI